MKKNRKWKRVGIIVLLFFLLLLVAAGTAFAWKKRRGIYNIISEKTGFTLPYSILEPYFLRSYGYYDKAVKISSGQIEHAYICENDDSSDRVETAISKSKTLVDSTYQIDCQLQEEARQGYTWEEPLVVIDPYQLSALTAVVLFETEEEAEVRFTVKGKTASADVSGMIPKQKLHQVPVVGLYPETENEVLLELLDDAGQVTDRKTITIETDALPEQMEDLIRPVKTSGESAYGLTMVYGQKVPYPFGYDCNGDIRWYIKVKATYGLYPMANGRILYQDVSAFLPSTMRPQSTNLYEIDYLGRVHSMYYVPEGNHHEILEKEPGGNLLLLSSSLEGTMEDLVIEMDRDNGEIVNRLKLQDVLDDVYRDQPDWAHMNTISYQPEDDTIILSARNLMSAIKLNWSTHELVWILGDKRFWEGTPFEKYVLTPTEDFTYHFMQHAVYQIDADLDGDPDTKEITMFDNHGLSVRKSQIDYFDDPDESYLLVYSVNEKEGTVSQIGKFPVIFSKITSNTIYDEESGHIFGMCGWVLHGPDDRNGMTYEIDYETGEICNQFSIKHEFYRAEEMIFNFADMASPMTLAEGYIRGELRKPVETKKKVEVPETKLSEEVELHLVGSVLYVKAPDHHISQIVLKGNTHTYVYDLSEIRLHAKKYLSYRGSLPVPLTELESDTYQVLCMYKNEFCDSGQTFTIP